ncbi:MerR family transcriptional regulator [Acetobacter sacchari]|uniref:MerR family transcriptional regulator n=1 Tax=Acetobacter sacchari TaxID=2661687 RepID=A0ABS3LXX5_9PROT|nr:MerR family transcriptional regulator [Acetobacter sacchari]MBO1360753.1 MerR family transcriptional regulator [Acetobacter sacchari]
MTSATAESAEFSEDLPPSADQAPEDGDLKGRKGPLAFRTISEVADELNVPQHVLRFWEARFEQVKPLKRGGGRRYYRPEDVELLKRISTLLYVQGYTIRGVQRVLRGQESEHSDDPVVVASQPDTSLTSSPPDHDRAPDNESAVAPADLNSIPPVTAPPPRIDANRLREELSEILVELEALRHYLG